VQFTALTPGRRLSWDVVVRYLDEIEADLGPDVIRKVPIASLTALVHADDLALLVCSYLSSYISKNSWS
jgi:hypothetical protein